MPEVAVLPCQLHIVADTAGVHSCVFTAELKSGLAVSGWSGLRNKADDGN